MQVLMLFMYMSISCWMELSNDYVYIQVIFC